MSPTLLSTLALLSVLHTHTVNASWRMRTANLLTARMDPLVSPNGLSSHVHNVVGGNNFAATYDYNKLRESTCSSVDAQDDKSNYWAPSLYYKHKDTGKFELVHSDWAVYYLHRGDEKTVQQFPEGFRMITGSPSRSTVSSDPADQALSFHCLSFNEPPIPETQELPKRHCPEGVRIQVLFPPCWNGKDVTSANNRDHVSYPVGVREGGTCPSTHPVRLMTIFIEQIAQTGNFEYYDGAFVLSTGDNIGYSSHADFQNGWDASPNSVLQQAINTCTDDTNGDLTKCGVINASNSENFNVCRPNSLLPVEDVGIYGNLDKLPGDNPIWGGSVPKQLTGVSNNPPWGSAFSTLPQGWVKHGCIDEGNPFVNTMTGDKFVDPFMYPQLCVDHCNSKGFTLAGLEAGQECYCANELTNGGSMNLIGEDKCGWVCPGSLYEFCGQSRKISLYQKTGNSTGASDGPNYPPVGSRLTQVFTNDGTSKPMTNSAAVNTPRSHDPPSKSNSTSGSNHQHKSAPSNTTSSPSVCTNGKMVKRMRSLGKRELVEPFHVPAKHRRTPH